VRTPGKIKLFASPSCPNYSRAVQYCSDSIWTPTYGGACIKELPQRSRLFKTGTGCRLQNRSAWKWIRQSSLFWSSDSAARWMIAIDKPKTSLREKIEQTVAPWSGVLSINRNSPWLMLSSTRKTRSTACTSTDILTPTPKHLKQ